VHEEYDIYCNMVKAKCKGYVFRLIETLEEEYKEILTAVVGQTEREEMEERAEEEVLMQEKTQ
jgi:hypothetical protein